MADIPITPAAAAVQYPRTSPHTFDFTATPSVTWSSSAGTMSGPGTTGTLTYPNRTQAITVSAVNGGDSGSAILHVYGTWPVNPHFGYEVQIDNKVVGSFGEDGSLVSRRKGPARYSWAVNFRNTPEADMILMRDFWLFHMKDIPFYFEDLEFPENLEESEVSTVRLVTADAGMRVVVDGPDTFTVSMAFKEIQDNTGIFD